MSLNTADIVFYEESHRRPEHEKEYRICFIDGHSLQYREFTTKAKSRDDAIQEMGRYYDLAFDHRFLFIYEDGIQIYEEGETK